MVLADTVKSLWSYNPAPRGCVLYLPLWASGLRGAKFRSVDYYRHLYTVTGATWGSQGRSFNGTSDLITGPTETVFDFTTQNFSIIMWVKRTTQAGNIQLIGRGLHQVDGWIILTDANGPFELYTYTSGDLSRLSKQTANTIPLDTWACIAAVRIGTSGALYKDGVDLAPLDVATARNPATCSRTMKIGRYDSAQWYFKGEIGESLIYNRDLNAAEIQRIYLATRGRYI